MRQAQGRRLTEAVAFVRPCTAKFDETSRSLRVSGRSQVRRSDGRGTVVLRTAREVCSSLVLAKGRRSRKRNPLGGLRRLRRHDREDQRGLARLRPGHHDPDMMGSRKARANPRTAWLMPNAKTGRSPSISRRRSARPSGEDRVPRRQGGNLHVAVERRPSRRRRSRRTYAPSSPSHAAQARRRRAVRQESHRFIDDGCWDPTGPSTRSRRRSRRDDERQEKEERYSESQRS